MYKIISYYEDGRAKNYRRLFRITVSSKSSSQQVLIFIRVEETSLINTKAISKTSPSYCVLIIQEAPEQSYSLRSYQNNFMFSRICIKKPANVN